MMKNNEKQYGFVAKTLHWLLFLLLTITVVMGNFLASMPNGPQKLASANLHKSFGVVLLALILARLFWRLINVQPKLPADTTPLQVILAKGMHVLLYVLMLAQPLSGILMTQAAGYPVSVFEAFQLPVLVEKSQALAGIFKFLHGAIWIVLVIAVVGHIAAALHHHFVKRDDVLKQMTRGIK
ncbi:MAG: cytochrome b [Shewanella sp.]|nr:cytochrome b [Shewanella sp.]MCF1456274.1 cytochrome b [Shewanella sp.]